MSRRTRTRRPGYTLIELMIASASSAILMGGLASALYISSRALLPDATATDECNRSALALAQMEGDLRLALNFTERTARAVTFTVPDRNGDSQVDTIRYSWTGTAGDPLLYQYNANAAVALATNVQQFNVSALTRTIPADVLPVPPASVVYHAPFTENESNGSTSLTLASPSGVASGNLLIAAVALDKVFGATVTAPTGWSLLHHTHSNSKVSLAVWWKIASASEPANYAFSWPNTEKSYGWMARFSGAESTTPGFVVNTGVSTNPTCLAMTTAVNNAMVLRVVAAEGDSKLGHNNSGMSNHTTITMDDGDGSVCGGATYRMLPVAGTTGTATFGLTGSKDFVTFTMAISPDDGI